MTKINCFGFQLNKDDNYPHFICNKCLNTLKKYYEFKKTCLKNEEQYKQYIENQQIEGYSTNSSRSTSPFINDLSSRSPSPILEDEVSEQIICEITPNVVLKNDSKVKKKSTKQYQCETCGKFLSNHSNLVQHTRKHTGEKPFSCDICKKSFFRAEHVTNHRRIHTGKF